MMGCSTHLLGKKSVLEPLSFQPQKVTAEAFAVNSTVFGQKNLTARRNALFQNWFLLGVKTFSATPTKQDPATPLLFHMGVPSPGVLETFDLISKS